MNEQQTRQADEDEVMSRERNDGSWPPAPPGGWAEGPDPTDPKPPADLPRDIVPEGPKPGRPVDTPQGAFEFDPEAGAMVETITPDMARAFLAASKAWKNRKLDMGRVRGYAEEMRQGVWTVTDTISITPEGRLINGQHRLTACIHADTPFRALVFRGATDDSFENTDGGKIRNQATVAYIAGIADSSKVIPVVRTIFGIQQYEGRSRPKSFSHRYPIRRVLKFAEAHTEALSYSVHTVRGSAIARPPSLWGALYFLIGTRGGEAGRDWMHQVLTGEYTELGDPSHAVRERTIRQSGNRSLDAVITADFVIHEWHAFLQGRKINKSIAGTGKIFPEIQGNREEAKRYRNNPRIEK